MTSVSGSLASRVAVAVLTATGVAIAVAMGDVPTPAAHTASAHRAVVHPRAVRPVRALPTSRSGFRLTTYYTAVERYHHARPVAVTGCPQPSCPDDTADLGSYPADFLAAVRLEGAGRVTSGPHTGRYLEWSYSVGYWLDTVPRDEHGRPLVPYVTAAADRTALGNGTRFRVTGCGHDRDSGDPTVPATCRALRSGTWTVTDTFTPGYGGARHVDLYVGDENRPDFAGSSPALVDATGARLLVGS